MTLLLGGPVIFQVMPWALAVQEVAAAVLVRLLSTGVRLLAEATQLCCCSHGCARCCGSADFSKKAVQEKGRPEQPAGGPSGRCLELNQMQVLLNGCLETKRSASAQSQMQSQWVGAVEHCSGSTCPSC